MKKKNNLTRLGILLAAAVLLIIYLAVPGVNGFVNEAVSVLGSANLDAVAEYIRSFGGYAFGFSFLLMVFSSVIAPLPAFMITLSNAAIFGWWQGAILSWSSAMVGAALCFFLARGLGRDVVEKIAGRGALASVEGYFKKHGTKTILVCRLLPFVSFDAVSYFAGLTQLTVKQWLLIVAVGRLPSLITSTATGAAAGEKNYVLTVVMLAVTAVLTVAGIVYYRYIAKQQRMEEEKTAK